MLAVVAMSSRIPNDYGAVVVTWALVAYYYYNKDTCSLPYKCSAYSLMKILIHEMHMACS